MQGIDVIVFILNLEFQNTYFQFIPYRQVTTEFKQNNKSVQRYMHIIDNLFKSKDTVTG